MLNMATPFHTKMSNEFLWLLSRENNSIHRISKFFSSFIETSNMVNIKHIESV